MKPDLHLLARSRYTWGGFMLAAYFSSAIWYGDGVFTAPVHLILFAPYGLITLFHLVGLPDDEGTRLYCWAGLHVLFWPLFVAFMWSLPRFSTRSLRFGAACLVLTVLANLSGCYYDAKKQKMQPHIKTPSEIWLERHPLFPTTDQPHRSPTRSPQKADE